MKDVPLIISSTCQLEDENLWKNRLALLGRIANLSYGIVDMSFLPGF